MTIREIFEYAKSKGLEDTPLEIEYTCNDDWYNFNGDTNNPNVSVDKIGDAIVLSIDN